MKNWIVIFALIFGLSACKDSNTNNLNSNDISFQNEIHPNKTDWKLNSIYKDTLQLITYDPTYVRPYAIFKTKNNATVSMVADEKINNKLSHYKFEVEWQIDSFPEKNKPDSYYYDEHIVHLNLINDAVYFGDFLLDFIKAYSNSDSTLLQPFIKESVGFNVATPNDTYCEIIPQDLPSTKVITNKKLGIFEEELTGNLCDGLPNIEDGLYFTDVTYDDLPWYDIKRAENKVVEKTFHINPDFVNRPMKKVSIIIDGNFYKDLYFLNINHIWYLWAEDNCRCSN
jgi:hypothetical protein